MKSDICALRGLHLRYYSPIGLITPARPKAVLLSGFMKDSWVIRPLSFTTNTLGTCCSSMCTCVCLRCVGRHTHTFLDKPLLYFSHPWQENTGLNKDWITKAFSPVSMFLATISGPTDPLSLRQGPRVMIRAGYGWDWVAGRPCLPCDWMALGLLWPVMWWWVPAHFHCGLKSLQLSYECSADGGGMLDVPNGFHRTTKEDSVLIICN